MMKNTGLRNQRVVQGQSMIELALLLPLMLMLVFGVIDYARAIQYNNILVAISREGANLSARTSASPQAIIAGLSATAEPLVMNTHGMIYITKIMGTKVGSNVEARVEAQTRATSGDGALYSSLPRPVWNHCNAWINDVCTNIPSGNNTATLPIVNGANMTLSEGEEVYAVEVLYNYTVIFNYVMKTGPELYSLTVL